MLINGRFLENCRLTRGPKKTTGAVSLLEPAARMQMIIRRRVSIEMERIRRFILTVHRGSLIDESVLS
jgi:hypothetical protein